jgi:hypothetical protein
MTSASLSRSLRNHRPAVLRQRARRSYALRRACGSRSWAGRIARWFAFPVFPLDTRGVAGLLAVSVFGFNLWWGHTMDVTGSAIDVYPSRWLSSPGFLGAIAAGTAAGWCLWASLLPWRPLRIAAAIAMTLATLGLFHASLGTGMWFEMYDRGDPLPSWFPLAVDGTITAAVLGWLLALAVLGKRLLLAICVGAFAACRSIFR